ncbi:hypothetical protein PBI_VANISOA_48 [Mycobacterium phage Vanisoa]|nr:hypothetical protein PBI_VANISOA_48 [Mycobacterium phage Vanisoa]
MSYHDTPASQADITHRFAFHAATTAEKKAEHGTVRTTIADAAHELDALVPPGREKALAITKLEEAMFWANAAIARNA